MSIESMMPSNYLFYCPLLLLPSIFPIKSVISNESALHTRWPKYWSFSFSISPFNDYSWLISFRIDWLFCHKETLKNLFQNCISKASILQCSAFIMVQLSQPYMITGKTIALTAAAAAAAKSLQSCPTLCDPIDGSLPGSSLDGPLLAK